jgi:hypothetical protein
MLAGATCVVAALIASASPTLAASAAGDQVLSATPIHAFTSRTTAAAGVNVSLAASADTPVVVAGMGFTVFAHVETEGTLPNNTRLGYTLYLPVGVTLSGPTSPVCTAADPSALHCVGLDSGSILGVDLKVAASASPGSALPIRIVLDLLPGDSNSTDDTATTRIPVILPSDLSVSWSGPGTPAKPGELVSTTVSVTNHGPDPVPVSLRVSYPDLPDNVGVARSFPLSKCSADPMEFQCELGGFEPATPAVLVPGQTAPFVFTWRFKDSDADSTFRISARLVGQSALESDPANDTAVLNLRIGAASPAAPPSSTSLPTSAPTATPSPPSKDAPVVLAATGSPSGLITGLGLCLVALGTVLLSVTRRRITL